MNDDASLHEFLKRVREHARPELSADELASLKLRVLPRLGRSRLAASRVRRPGLALAFAVAASAAVSLAAAGSVWVWSAQSQRAEVRRTVPSPGPHLAGNRVEGSRAAPAVRLPAAASSQVGSAGPALVERHAGAASGAPRASSGVSKPASSGLWSDAASALRDDDLPRAERALGELAGSSDRVTRDSAELALAEMWMKRQQVSRARSALGRLARSGATPAIRQRASQLLGELPR